MILETLGVATVLVLVVTGVPQKVYRRYEDKVGDGIFWCKEKLVKTKTLMGSMDNLKKLRFEDEKVELALFKTEKAIRKIYAAKVTIQSEVDKWQAAKDAYDGHNEVGFGNLLKESQGLLDQINEQYDYAIAQKETQVALLEQINTDLIQAEASRLMANSSMDVPGDVLSRKSTSLKDKIRLEAISKTGDMDVRETDE